MFYWQTTLGAFMTSICERLHVKISDNLALRSEAEGTNNGVLLQLFEWTLELIQARRLWLGHPEQQYVKSRGLLFPTDGYHGQHTPTPLGSLQFYAAGGLEFLAAAGDYSN
jgi:hypothetical protein